MHDGSIATLAEIITFYEGGGGGNAERLQPFQLDANERVALLAFLEML
jgi:cytochrome c peroxidase